MSLKSNYHYFLEKYPIIVALLTQVLVLFILRNFFKLTFQNVPALIFCLTHILICGLLYSRVFKLPYWFLIIALIFPFIFYLSFNYIHINSTIYGSLFTILFLTFSHTLKERVPLYLSNQTTLCELEKIVHNLIEKDQLQFIDLGSGTGKVVRFLNSNKIIADGAETAPTLFLYSRLMSLFLGGRILNKSIWEINLGKYDCVYTFLSPAVMDKIYEKLNNEMKTGSVLISNSFPIKNIKPDQKIILNDKRKTTFYIYRKK